MDRAYDRFSIELRRVQLLYSQPGRWILNTHKSHKRFFLLNVSDEIKSPVGENWKSARTQRSSLQHVLHPMDFTVQLGKCMVEKDARMPR